MSKPYLSDRDSKIFSWICANPGRTGVQMCKAMMSQYGWTFREAYNGLACLKNKKMLTKKGASFNTTYYAVIDV